MEIAGAAAGEGAKSAIGHVEREFGYLIHFKKNTNTLNDNIQQLTATKSDVQTLMDAAVRNGKVVKETVEEWMKRADCVLVQAKKVSEEAGLINSWFKGWCCGRFSLGRKAQKTFEDIQRIIEEGRRIAVDGVANPISAQSLPIVGIEDFNAFASRESTAKEIRKALLDDEINLVGVHGMPGVGKTTLIKDIAKQVKKEGLFQEVVVVTVSQNPNLLKLQGDIAERLDLSLTGENLSMRAERLYDRLDQNDKTSLIILDDVWESIELFKVGIPYKNKGMCCKVVLTTRVTDVCDGMQANAKMEVAVLSEKDSWILFQQRSGIVADSSLARDVLNECKGLPLAIVTLGLALRNKDAMVWQDSLRQLRNNLIFKRMSSVVSSIKLSYNFLESESVKICFLFCCLFPEDHAIKLEQMLSYVMGEKVVEDVDTYEDARGRLYSILEELVSSGLLLKDEKGHIMMHDVVRDVAISIGKEEHYFIVKAGSNLRYWPDHMDLENCKRLSMMHNSIQHLPTIPIKAPHLQALFLNDNHSLTEIPSEFFVDMKSLMTLDLSRTCIEFLPPSLSCLENLCTLLLNNTNLNNLSPISKLERLEVLDLTNTRFTNKEVLEEIGNLSNLRILDLSNTSLGNSIRPTLFSKLGRLEEFHVLEYSMRARLLSQIQGFSFLESDGIRESDVLHEIGSLSRLTFLEMQIHHPELCHIDIPGPWQNLTRFQIFIYTSKDGITVFSRSLDLCSIRGKELANWVLVLLGRTNHLKLSRCHDLLSFTELGSAATKLGMEENLKSLSLWKCSKMECLVSNQNVFLTNLVYLRIECMDAFVEICKGAPPARLFQKLKTLYIFKCDSLVTVIPRKLIHNLRNLESLTINKSSNVLHIVQMEEEEEEESLVSSNSNLSGRITISDTIFPNLKRLEIIDIPQIRYVFTMRVARNLLRLEQLEIYRCSEMEVLFKYGDGEDIKFDQDTAILPRLKRLDVYKAPQLKSFTNQINLVMEFPSLEYLKLSECGMLERLPFGTASVPNLNELLMKQEDFHKLKWEDESVKARLQSKLKE